MHSLLGPQFDAEIAYRQERTRAEFAGARHEGSGLGRLITRHRRSVTRERLRRAGR